jgi:hypothetical protein
MAKSKSKSSVCAVDSEVIRKIRQHARSHMKTEVCGVLIGDIREGAIWVDQCIPGLNASQAGSHVTFTQDTWEHVYKIKDKEFPEARIVGGITPTPDLVYSFRNMTRSFTRIFSRRRTRSRGSTTLTVTRKAALDGWVIASNELHRSKFLTGGAASWLTLRDNTKPSL